MLGIEVLQPDKVVLSPPALFFDNASSFFFIAMIIKTTDCLKIQTLGHFMPNDCAFLIYAESVSKKRIKEAYQRSVSKKRIKQQKKAVSPA